MVVRGRVHEVLGHMVNDEAYLSIKELSYAARHCFPSTQSFVAYLLDP